MKNSTYKSISNCVAFSLFAASMAIAAPSRLDSLTATVDSLARLTNPPTANTLAELNARIDTWRQIAKDDPGSSELQPAMQTCSLLVEIAKVESHTATLNKQRDSIWQRRLTTSSQVLAIQKEIQMVETGYAGALARDLDDYKKKLEEERQKLLEEQNKARERQDDARKKLDMLQSQLIQVSKTARGIILSMSDILFEVGKATLTNDLKTSLARVAGIMTVYQEANILVEGHTDNTGSAELNQKLSEQRALNVMEFMVTQGIVATRMKSSGYGFTQPVAPNDTPEGRQKNRRVDLVIQDKALGDGVK